MSQRLDETGRTCHKFTITTTIKMIISNCDDSILQQLQ